MRYALRGLRDDDGYGDPAKVMQVDGVYQITFETQTQIGDTAITYWPNRFSDPEISFDVKN